MIKNSIQTRTAASSSAFPMPNLRLNPLAAVLAAGLFALPSVRVLAATINVGVGGCTLADAITAANTDRAQGGCRAGRDADTLVLPSSSTQTLTRVNNDEDTGANGLPVVRSRITIQGNGSTIRRRPDAAPFRILSVSTSGNLSLQRTTISGGLLSGEDRYEGAGIRNEGRLDLTGSAVRGNSGGSGLANSGTLSLIDSTVTGNTGSGIANSFATLSLSNSMVSSNIGRYGGGIFNYYGTVSLINSSVSGNRADDVGGIVNRFGSVSLVNSSVSGNVSAHDSGGIFNYYGPLVLSNSSVSGNTSTEWGGGIFGFAGTVTLNNSTLSDNTGTIGGGIYSVGILNINHSTVSGNSASAAGGGVYVSDRRFGSTVTIRSSTFSGNVAANGGGLVNGGQRVVISTSTITDNTATSGRGAGLAAGTEFFPEGTEAFNDLSASIVAGNHGSDVENLLADVDAFVSRGDNLIGNGNAMASFAARGDQIRVAHPGLNVLADNGGLTLTHSLIAGSPAIDAVTSTCKRPATDQRGAPRPVDGDSNGIAKCDIGAVEFGAVVPAQADRDADGVPDALDNCPATFNPDQSDRDEDGIGDVCDDSPLGRCEGRNITIRGTLGDDELIGTPGDDVIAGLGGDDRIVGAHGDDLLCGGDGDDTLIGGAGNDRLVAGPGLDNLSGGKGDDTLLGGAGKDSLDGGKGRDSCDGGTERDTAKACEQRSNIP